MALVAKLASAYRAFTDAHGVPVTQRNVRNYGPTGVRGGNPIIDANNDEAAFTMVCDADQNLNTTPGVNQFVAGGPGTSGPVWLARAVVVATGSGTITIYDNAGPAGTTTGNILIVIPATATLGQMFDIRCPVTLGMSIINAASAVKVNLVFG